MGLCWGIVQVTQPMVKYQQKLQLPQAAHTVWDRAEQTPWIPRMTAHMRPQPSDRSLGLYPLQGMFWSVSWHRQGYASKPRGLPKRNRGNLLPTSCDAGQELGQWHINTCFHLLRGAVTLGWAGTWSFSACPDLLSKLCKQLSAENIM